MSKLMARDLSNDLSYQEMNISCGTNSGRRTKSLYFYDWIQYVLAFYHYIGTLLINCKCVIR